MKYQPWKVIEESFRKHMIIPQTDVGERQLYHNFEYFKWHVNGDTGEVTYYDEYTPLDCCYGQDEAIPKIKKDLAAYITLCRSFLVTVIMEAVYELKGQKIPVEEIQIPGGKNGYNWYSLVGGHIFGKSEAKRS